MIYEYIWVFFIFVVVANAVFFRIDAQQRIIVDPSLRAPLNRLYGGFAFWLGLPFLLMGAGIASGMVDGVVSYLRFDGNNQLIVAWWALIFAEDALFIFWVFFRRGDEKLSLHTEITQARPKFRIGVRILALALPILHGATLFYSTSSPHFGQWPGANGT